MLLVLGLTGVAAPPVDASESAVIAYRDYRVAGITLGDSRATVGAALGAPLREVASADPDAEGRAVTLHYAGMAVFIEGDEVMNIAVTAPGFAVKGVEVGDPLDKALARLGGNVLGACDGPCLRYTVLAPGGDLTDAYLLLHIRDGRVAEIEFWFDYT